MEIPSRFKTNTSSFHHYWTAGAGVELLKKLPKQPDLREANKLVPYLFTCDEPADELVRTLHQQVGFGKGQQLLRAYLVAPENVDEPYKEALDTFFSSIESSASWLNWELLESGIAVSQRAGLSGLIVLRDYCLMGGYESAAINKPLIYTGTKKRSREAPGRYSRLLGRHHGKWSFKKRADRLSKSNGNPHDPCFLTDQYSGEDGLGQK